MHKRTGQAKGLFSIKNIISNPLALSVLTSLLVSMPMTTVSQINGDAEQAQGGSENSDKVLYQSMLAGGSLKVCSSYSPQNCDATKGVPEGKTQIRYEINTQAIQRLDKFMQETPVQSTKKALSSILEALNKLFVNETFSRNELFDFLEKKGLLEQVDSLDDHAYFALLDHLELAQMQNNEDRLGFKRMKEVANVSLSRSAASKAVFSAFVEQIKHRAANAKQSPHVLIVTASSRDAFEAIDFYQSAFASMSINATWLPVDMSVAKAVDDKAIFPNACNRLDEYRQQNSVFDRDRIYPELSALQAQFCNEPQRFTALIEHAQAVFINGGDQSKTLSALRSKHGNYFPFWQQILNKVNAGGMIVGGTSAGAAVQSGTHHAGRPIPMISNGRSKEALKRGPFAALAPSQRCAASDCNNGIGRDDLTYMPSGGIASFDIGLVDTHFSERDREGRLISLALSQNLRLAVGVDETSAVFYRRSGDWIHLSVIGENGAFFVDGFNSMQTRVIEQNRRSTKLAGFAHYLPNGSAAKVNLVTNEWELFGKLSITQSNKKLPMLDDGVWRNSVRKYCGTKEPISWQFDEIDYLLAPSQQTRFFIDNDQRYCGYLFLPFVVSNQ